MHELAGGGEPAGGSRAAWKTRHLPVVRPALAPAGDDPGLGRQRRVLVPDAAAPGPVFAAARVVRVEEASVPSRPGRRKGSKPSRGPALGLGSPGGDRFRQASPARSGRGRTPASPRRSRRPRGRHLAPSRLAAGPRKGRDGGGRSDGADRGFRDHAVHGLDRVERVPARCGRREEIRSATSGAPSLGAIGAGFPEDRNRILRVEKGSAPVVGEDKRRKPAIAADPQPLPFGLSSRKCRLSR